MVVISAFPSELVWFAVHTADDSVAYSQCQLPVYRSEAETAASKAVEPYCVHVTAGLIPHWRCRQNLPADFFFIDLVAHMD